MKSDKIYEDIEVSLKGCMGNQHEIHCNIVNANATCWKLTGRF